MDFWKNTADAVTKAVNDLMEKNRRTAVINRLKIVVRNEKDIQNKAYEQLGRYYYQNLRDPQNGDTETYCAAIEKSSARLGRAYAKLDELTVPSGCCGGCGQEDDACCCGEETAEEEPDGPVSPLIREEANPANEEAAGDADDPFSAEKGGSEISDPQE